MKRLVEKGLRVQCALALVAAWVMPMAVAGEKSTQLMVSAVARDESDNGTAVLLHALGGDLSDSGYLARFKVGVGQYSYQSSALADPTVDVTAYSADALIGYQFVKPSMKYRVFLGANHLDTQLSPDEASSPSEGSRTGGAVYLQAMSRGWGRVHFAPSAYYSAAFDNYHAKLQLGWKFTHFTLGPEVVALGSRSFEGQRVGLFLSGLKFAGIGWGLSAGYSLADEENLDSNSAYMGISANKQF